jgi:hypothetical protein
MPDFDDPRLFTALREYVVAADALAELDPRGEPRRTLDLAERKSLAAMALRRRLAELGWTPPLTRPAGDRIVGPSSGQAPQPTVGRDVDI